MRKALLGVSLLPRDRTGQPSATAPLFLSDEAMRKSQALATTPPFTDFCSQRHSKSGSSLTAMETKKRSDSTKRMGSRCRDRESSTAIARPISFSYVASWLDFQKGKFGLRRCSRSEGAKCGKKAWTALSGLFLGHDIFFVVWLLWNSIFSI